jgi:hypothetical protein
MDKRKPYASIEKKYPWRMPVDANVETEAKSRKFKNIRRLEIGMNQFERSSESGGF